MFSTSVNYYFFTIVQPGESKYVRTKKTKQKVEIIFTFNLKKISSIDPETNDITLNTINSLPEDSQNRKNKVKNGELLPIPRSKTNMSKPNAVHNKLFNKNRQTKENLNIKDVISEKYHGKKISSTFIPKIKKHIYRNKNQKRISDYNRKLG